MSQFWILATICFIGCVIGAAIDYFNAPEDRKSRTAILIGYAIVFGASLLAAWGLKSIPIEIVYAAALLAFVFFGRYLMRQFANRKI